MRSLATPAAFFDSLREAHLLGSSLDQSEIDGLNAILQACGEAGWGRFWAAYALATAYHETAGTMKPVREAYWLSEAWRKKNLRYYPWYGRGYVQITWLKNYQKADDELGLCGTLVANLDRAMEPQLAADIMINGMREGWFTGKKIGDYITAQKQDYVGARRVINGTDKAQKIASHARDFQEALEAGAWS